MLQASTFVFSSYIGFEAVTTAAQEAKKPTRSLPMSIIGCLVISMLLYLIICTIMVGLISYKSLESNSLLSDAV